MKCVNCGNDANYVYKGNSLCFQCLELSKLKEITITSSMPKELLEQIKTKIDACNYWIKINRLANNWNHPEIIK